jgi:hypothetical protein
MRTKNYSDSHEDNHSDNYRRRRSSSPRRNKDQRRINKNEYNRSQKINDSDFSNNSTKLCSNTDNFHSNDAPKKESKYI